MIKHALELIPNNYQRIVLINPTKYLGNLLIAGGLIQKFEAFCSIHNKSLLIVIDEQYKDLLKGTLPSSSLLFYPRKKIESGNIFQKIKLSLHCLKKIRQFNADIAFNIEEDAVTNYFTMFSGAKFIMGCSNKHHRWKYDHVLPISFSQRSLDRKHRWHSYYDVFSTFSMPKPAPDYLQLNPDKLSPQLQRKMIQQGLNFSLPIIVIHSCATKAYKMWPVNNFITLIEKLSESGLQTVLIGSGQKDKNTNTKIVQALTPLNLNHPPINLVNQFSLTELESFLLYATAIIGNDSGPSHLASALGLDGCVLFGPTDVDIWSPLRKVTRIVTGREACSMQCNRSQCQLQYRCLSSIHPQQVMDELSLILSTSARPKVQPKVQPEVQSKEQQEEQEEQQQVA